MPNHCSAITCLDGNCPGCKDGVKWCSDPRCEPYCRGCAPRKRHEQAAGFVIVTTLIVLAFIILILLIFYGPRFVVFHDGDIDDPYEVDRSHGYGLPMIEEDATP